MSEVRTPAAAEAARLRVTSREEAVRRARERQAGEVAKLTTHVERAIAGWTNPGEEPIYVSGGGYGVAVLQAVAARYGAKDAGWDAKVVDDQRDGLYLVLR